MVEEYQDISVERLREYMARHEENEYLLVDVRQPDEYAKGHIAGSILIPLGEIPQRMQELPMDRDIICVLPLRQEVKGRRHFHRIAAPCGRNGLQYDRRHSRLGRASPACRP